MKVYECKNPACSLGTVGSPGRFSGGATKEQILIKTGNPDPEHYGEGVCPECCTKADDSLTIPDPHEGRDPFQKHHDAVAARVADPDDNLTGEDAQDALYELVSDAHAPVAEEVVDDA